MRIGRLAGLWAPVAVFMIGLFLLSADVAPPVVMRKLSDKVVHAVAYCLLGVFTLRACHRGIQPLRHWPTILAMLMTLTYGALDEWHQAYVPGRFPSLYDWFADAAGAGLSMVLVWSAAAWRSRRSGGGAA